MSKESEPYREIPIIPIAPRPCLPLKPMEPVRVPLWEPKPEKIPEITPTKPERELDPLPA